MPALVLKTAPRSAAGSEDAPAAEVLDSPTSAASLRGGVVVLASFPVGAFSGTLFTSPVIALPRFPDMLSCLENKEICWEEDELYLYAGRSLKKVFGTFLEVASIVAIGNKCC